MIGFLMLMGIVAKNSILLVDYTKQLIDSGMGQAEAIVDDPDSVFAQDSQSTSRLTRMADGRITGTLTASPRPRGPHRA